MPKERFELSQAFAHHPLKMACLPASTTSAQKQHGATISSIAAAFHYHLFGILRQVWHRLPLN